MSVFSLPRNAPKVQPIDVQTEAARLFFGDTRFRPDPRSVAALIGHGLTEQTIQNAALENGMPIPIMDLTSEDLETGLPHYQRICDVLADRHNSDKLLLAGRDAEALHDDLVISHPDIDSYLLPASTPLWRSRTMEDRKLATGFFGNYGLTRQFVRRPLGKVVLVDSGFEGSIGLLLDAQMHKTYNRSLSEKHALVVKLVCATKWGIGTPILSLPDGEPRVRSVKFNKSNGITDGYIPYNHSGTNTFGLAVGLQLMPRFHGHFGDLRRVNGTVRALPVGGEMHLENVDIDCRDYNTSVVNPVAAAIIQLRIVAAALERSGNQALFTNIQSYSA